MTNLQKQVILLGVFFAMSTTTESFQENVSYKGKDESPKVLYIHYFRSSHISMIFNYNKHHNCPKMLMRKSSERKLLKISQQQRQHPNSSLSEVRRH